MKISPTRGNIQNIATPYTEAIKARRMNLTGFDQVCLGGIKTLYIIMYRTCAMAKNPI